MKDIVITLRTQVNEINKSKSLLHRHTSHPYYEGFRKCFTLRTDTSSDEKLAVKAKI